MSNTQEGSSEKRFLESYSYTRARDVTDAPSTRWAYKIQSGGFARVYI